MATRRESVHLSLVDDFTPGMAKAAAITAVLNRELHSLSGHSVAASRSTQAFARDLGNVSREARNAENSINQLTGRLRLFADVAAIFGPGLAPVGGVLAAGVAGFASQLGFAAVAGGVLAGSMQGLGDALGAMNKAQLEPTNKNLEAAESALKRLGPAAAEFAEQAFALKPALVAIRDIGSEALFPGLTESLDSLERLGPRVGAIFEAVASAAGEIAADSAASLASDRWADFFQFVEDEAPRALSEMATTVGSVTHGLAEMWQAFTPLNNDFSGWLMDVAAGFDSWATGLSATEGFQEFVDYIRTTGPQVADTLGALANAVVQIVQATAPLGGPVLAAVEGFAKAIGAIADSDLGTPIFAGIAALALLNRTLAVTAALSKTSLSSGMFAGLGTASKGIKGQAGSIRSDIAAMSDTMVAFGANTEKAGQAADRMKQRLATGAGLAGLAVAATGAADGIGLTNTASLALMGSFAGPVGIAVGATAGAFLDLKAAGEGATAAIDGLDAAAQSGDLGVLTQQLADAKAELAALQEMNDGGGGLDGIIDRLQFGAADAMGGKNVAEATAEVEKGEKAVKALAEAEAAREAGSRRAVMTYASEVGLNADLSVWRRRSVEDIKAQADALAEVSKQAQGTAQSFLGFGDSLNDSKKSLSAFIQDMQNSADALRNFNANSLRAARRGLDEGLISSLRAAGKEGALRMKQLANATESEIARANKAHRSQTKALEETERVAVRLAGLAPVVKVKAETAGAMNDINGLEARLRAIKDEDVNVVVRTINTGDTQFGPRNKAADGTFVPKTGKPYADRHLYLLADGEGVTTNRRGETDRFRDVISGINRGYSRMAIKGMLAEGGTAGETDAQKKAREAQEKARRAAEERRQREEERRQRRLDAQRTKDLLASDLRDEEEQARLEVVDARRRLRSAKRADRSPQEIREARLALKSERSDVRDMRDQKAQDAEDERIRKEEEAAEHQSKMFLSAIEGQERAAQGLIDAAEKQKDLAEQTRDEWKQAMERVGAAATAGFQSDLFGAQQHGLWSNGPGGGSGTSWFDALTGDISGLQQRQGLISQLSAQGITGSALEALLGQGSNDQIAGLLGSGRAGEFATMFAQREALLGSTSSMAGQAAYGAQYAAATAQVAVYGARIAFLEARLAAISAQRPITVYEAYSAQATAAEVARLQAMQGAA